MQRPHLGLALSHRTFRSLQILQACRPPGADDLLWDRCRALWSATFAACMGLPIYTLSAAVVQLGTKILRNREVADMNTGLSAIALTIVVSRSTYRK